VNDDLGRWHLRGLAANAISHVEEVEKEKVNESNCAFEGSYLFPTLNWKHGVEVYPSIYRTTTLWKSQPAFSCFPPFQLFSTFLTLI